MDWPGPLDRCNVERQLQLLGEVRIPLAPELAQVLREAIARSPGAVDAAMAPSAKRALVPRMLEARPPVMDKDPDRAELAAQTDPPITRQRRANPTASRSGSKMKNVWLDVLFITEYLTASPASKGLLKRGAADPGSAQGDPGV